ncbi:cold shock and DUF1294 domain-containing protein [Colwellia sp. BRX10-3]|uniref:cold shock and DUF1294 domain-containing protein n=1 Tax=Colwellia sp. BRX10-3 TaxID=2759844 RepID=UPI0015F66747|nr:cold shock and DUF1294 domain-containing protein [Colwellia sp. BRX10-3]MBA6391623.1 cold shock and DUF1294 domain-containing protein [Colwellia sp. BRX10-3]
MRLKGKLVKWQADKAFGFIAPNGGGSNIFIHKSAFANNKKIPQINDVITFSITKDKESRYCACDATFSGEKLKKKQPKKISKFSIYLSLIFLAAIIITSFLGYLPQTLMYIYLGLSLITYLTYAFDKSKAQRGAWRTSEGTLHLFALVGGWPGAALAQQYLRHKSSKREFRHVFWLTVVINMGILIWLKTYSGAKYLALFY